VFSTHDPDRIHAATRRIHRHERGNGPPRLDRGAGNVPAGL
jgi:hypothetical protein